MNSQTWIAISRRHRRISAVLTSRLLETATALDAGSANPFDWLLLLRLKVAARRHERRQHRHSLAALRDILKPVGSAN
jgi:hypothetical protein